MEAIEARTLDLQALRIFKAVADESSVTRAAAKLHYVQSNVTMRLRDLEATLGVELFHRVGGRLVITAAGITLRSYAERLLNLAQEARRSVVSDGKPRGPLRIGSMETTAAARLPRLLADFHRRHADVELTIETGPTAHLIQQVADFKLDAALIGGPAEHSSLEGQVVFDEELLLISARDHPSIVAPRDIADATLLMFRSGCSYRRRLESWLEHGGVSPRRVLEFGTFEGIVGCVAAGMGVSLMPRIIVEQRRLRQSVGIHAIPSRFRRMQTMMVWRRDADVLPARAVFLAMLQGAQRTSARHAARTQSRQRMAGG